MPKKNTDLKDNYFRIIKISKKALFEFIYEAVIDNQKAFFDISDATKIISHHDINFEMGEYICVVNNDSINSMELPNGIDLKELLSRIPDTTDSLFEPNRYIELSLEQIEELLSK